MTGISQGGDHPGSGALSRNIVLLFGPKGRQCAEAVALHGETVEVVLVVDGARAAIHR
jgi:hypothetical protein